MFFYRCIRTKVGENGDFIYLTYLVGTKSKKLSKKFLSIYIHRMYMNILYSTLKVLIKNLKVVWR